MKKTILTYIIAMMTCPLIAQQYNGFYRVQNRGAAGRYVSIQNTKVSDEAKNISYSSGVSVNTCVEALQLIRAKDKDSDAGTILYIKGSNDDLTLEAQGMNTRDLLIKLNQGNLKLKKSPKGELFTSVSGYPIYLLDYGFSYPATWTSSCGVATAKWINQELPTDEGNYIYWTFKKIDNEDEFFGVKPNEEIEIDGKYYTTLYTHFSYQLPENMKAFYIDKYNFDIEKIGTPIAELKEISSRKIPQNTPVIIECSSNNVSDNKLVLLEEELSPISDNKLEGNTFCYIPQGDEDPKLKNVLDYDKSTMRVLSSVNGKLALVADNNKALITKNGSKYIPANKAFLRINNTHNTATANGIRLLLPDEYEVAASISQVTTDKQSKTGIYTLTGVKVKENNTTEDLPNGLYIIDGKKQVIQN